MKSGPALRIPLRAALGRLFVLAAFLAPASAFPAGLENRAEDGMAQAPAAVKPQPVPQAVAAPADTALRRPAGMALTFSAVLQVEEQEKAAALVVARAESLGGWFSRRAKTTIELRLPTARADTFIQGLGDLGLLVDRNLSTQNLEVERDELASRLKARRATLKDYYAMLKESGDSTLFTIQNEMVGLQTEIEQTAGQILKLEDRMAHAQVAVHFRFQERGAALATGVSRFKWLNRLDLPHLMRRFEFGSP